MGREKECLTDDEFDKIMGVATRHSEEARRIVLILRWTGMHISVLCNPVQVRKEQRRNGRDTFDYDLKIVEIGAVKYFEWKRPKKQGKEATVRVQVSRHIDFSDDLTNFIKKIRSRRRKSNRIYYYRLIKEIGEKAGIPDLSPMSFRHTFGVSMLDMGFPQQLVRQKLNCTEEMLETYLKYSQQRTRDVFERLGW